MVDQGFRSLPQNLVLPAKSFEFAAMLPKLGVQSSIHGRKFVDIRSTGHGREPCRIPTDIEGDVAESFYMAGMTF